MCWQQGQRAHSDGLVGSAMITMLKFIRIIRTIRDLECLAVSGEMMRTELELRYR